MQNFTPEKPEQDSELIPTATATAADPSLGTTKHRAPHRGKTDVRLMLEHSAKSPLHRGDLLGYAANGAPPFLIDDLNSTNSPWIPVGRNRIRRPNAGIGLTRAEPDIRPVNGWRRPNHAGGEPLRRDLDLVTLRFVRLRPIRLRAHGQRKQLRS